MFEQAITSAPLTLPAHASLLTGAFPPKHTVRDNHVFALPDSVPTYPALFKQRGYATGAFVSAVVLDHRYGLNRGFDAYDDEISGPERSAADTIARAERWVDAATRPFFVWIHLFEPHAPYKTGSYAAEVTAADTALAGLFDHLKSRGLWTDAIVSVTSDHGESLGEHGERTHGFFVYDATLRIPWILKAPGLNARRVGQAVRIVDELPTIAALAEGSADADPKRPAIQADGLNLATLIASGAGPNLEAYSETFLPRDQFGWSSLTSIRTEHFQYIDAPNPELYDLTADARESTNVIESHAADADRLRRILGAIQRAADTSSSRTASDPLLTEKLMSLGYVGYSPAFADAGTARLADPKSKLDVYNLTMTALELSESGDARGALAALDKAERLDPNVAQVEFLKGTLLGQIGRYDAAAAALERTLALNPRYTAARFKLALAWLRLGRTDRATDALNDVVRQQPDDFRAWHNLAAVAYSRGDLTKAEALEKKAVSISPTYAEAWNTLGAIALVRKQPGAAIEALTKATSLAPRNGQAWQNLALAYRAAGQVDRARDAAARACAADVRFCSTANGRS